MMNFDQRYALCIQTFYHRPHFKVIAGIKASISNCCNNDICDNLGSPTSACIITLIMYTQFLHTLNGLLAVGRVANLPCGCSSYKKVSEEMLENYRPVSLLSEFSKTYKRLCILDQQYLLRNTIFPQPGKIYKHRYNGILKKCLWRCR